MDPILNAKTAASQKNLAAARNTVRVKQESESEEFSTEIRPKTPDYVEIFDDEPETVPATPLQKRTRFANDSGKRNTQTVSVDTERESTPMVMSTTDDIFHDEDADLAKEEETPAPPPTAEKVETSKPKKPKRNKKSESDPVLVAETPERKSKNPKSKADSAQQNQPPPQQKKRGAIALEQDEPLEPNTKIQKVDRQPRDVKHVPSKVYARRKVDTGALRPDFRRFSPNIAGRLHSAHEQLLERIAREYTGILDSLGSRTVTQKQEIEEVVTRFEEASVLATYDFMSCLMKLSRN
jgi:hypothetical protein